ncbi:MAG: ABC transporter ATP-binding protein [Clostridia bacterium]|nr:ABC transporter ATP-binding protein [Clostridia bacterium]
MKICFDHIDACIGGNRILTDVSVHAQHGRMTGIIGPNGCGKSTLLKTLFGIVKTDSGTITLDGKPISEMKRSEVSSLVGYVGQDIPCVFDFSVRSVTEMALYGRKGLSRRKRDSIVNESLASVGLLDLAERSILTLSGGERKLVFIARALAQGVETIVLDEPTNHLDIRHQLFIMDYLKKSGKTILIVLHDLRLAAYYCDEVFLLNKGHSYASGAPCDTLTTENIRNVFGIHGYAGNAAFGSDFMIDFNSEITL